MRIGTRTIGERLLYVGAALLFSGLVQPGRAADVLVADRLSNNVYRYSETGEFLGAVLPAPGDDDPLHLSQPVGLALSPDFKHLYVSSFQNARVIRYDYDYATGTASSGMVFADASDGLASPNAILFSEDGGTMYVANLGETGVARFNMDGSLAGPPLFFEPPDTATHVLLSGLAWTPDDELLVNSFRNKPTGAQGAVGRLNDAQTAIESYIEPSTALRGASGLIVHDDFVYVTGMFAGTIRRFHLADGSLDAAFAVNGLSYPQGLMASPHGNGLLVGILGVINGQGHIAHYDFSGALIGDGVFAAPGGGGFTEGTAFITVPDLPGDFNGDGLVDGADLDDPVVGWKARFGIELDGSDFLVWQRNLSPSPGVASVPEPRALWVALGAVVGAWWARRTRGAIDRGELRP